MANDVAQVLLEQADVHRVQDRAHARHGQVELEVPHRVPGEGGHTVAPLDAEPLERAGQASGALDHLPVRAALDAVLRPADELALGEHPLGPLRHVAYQERVVHHQSVHSRRLTREGGV
jgi:hypothetical protein